MKSGDIVSEPNISEDPIIDNTYRVATYSVMNVLLSLATFGGGRADRASPKSQTCRTYMN